MAESEPRHPAPGGCGAAAMYAYAAAGLVVGLVVTLGYGPLLGPLAIGTALVVVGVIVSARHVVSASVLLTAGGILVGGMIGVSLAAWVAEDTVDLGIGFAVGALLLGWPPIGFAGDLLATGRAWDRSGD